MITVDQVDRSLVAGKNFSESDPLVVAVRDAGVTPEKGGATSL
jgi:hypothetical protein